MCGHSRTGKWDPEGSSEVGRAVPTSTDREDTVLRVGVGLFPPRSSRVLGAELALWWTQRIEMELKSVLIKP